MTAAMIAQVHSFSSPLLLLPLLLIFHRRHISASPACYSWSGSTCPVRCRALKPTLGPLGRPSGTSSFQPSLTAVRRKFAATATSASCCCMPASRAGSTSGTQWPLPLRCARVLSRAVGCWSSCCVRPTTLTWLITRSAQRSQARKTRRNKSNWSSNFCRR